MKKFTLLFVLLFVWGVSNAQDTIRVAPDYTNGGALNKAISENGPNKVYLLEVNGFYDLNKTIEFLRPEGNPKAWYHIVGEIPKKAEDFMPVIQTGLTAENKPFHSMFTVKADVSFKNIFIVNQTTTSELGNFSMLVQDRVKLVMDGCMVDPTGRQGLMNGNELTAGSKLFITNNTILRHGDKYSPNGGHLFWGVLADTMYVENNSFVSTDAGLLAGGESLEKNMKFIWFNHNTVVFHDVSLLPNEYVPSTYINNNLFYDLITYVQQHAWAQFGSTDFALTGSYPSIIRADTAYVNGKLEPLPSSRTFMWNRNLVYMSPAVRDTILGAAAKDPTDNQLWQYPVLWNEETPHYYVTNWSQVGQNILDKARETKMFKSPDFPNFVEDNTWYDVDPKFVDPRIKEFTKDVASSAMFWYRLNKLLKGSNPAVQKSQFWDVDGWAGTSATMYPTVWPRWNGAYTNEVLLTASTEGLPLGDLNAFPEAKAKWEAEKESIMEHILSLKTGPYILTAVDDVKMSSKESFRIYPNPVNDIVTIESKKMLKNVKIYNMAGQLIEAKEINGRRFEMDLSELVKGMYVVKAEYNEGGTITTKLNKQ